MQNFKLNYLKKKIIKQIKYSGNSPRCNWFWLTEKARFLKPIEKKLYIVNYR